MNVYEWFFVVFIFGTFGITLFKVFNLMRVGKLYDLAKGFILFIVFTFVWFLGLMVVLTNPEVVLYMVLFQFGSLLFALNAVFIVFEVFFALRDRAEKTIMAYNSTDELMKSRIK